MERPFHKEVATKKRLAGNAGILEITSYGLESRTLKIRSILKQTNARDSVDRAFLRCIDLGGIENRAENRLVQIIKIRCFGFSLAVLYDEMDRK